MASTAVVSAFGRLNRVYVCATVLSMTKPTDKMERMQILIPPAMREEIERLAATEKGGVTLRMIRTLLREALDARAQAKLPHRITISEKDVTVNEGHLVSQIHAEQLAAAKDPGSWRKDYEHDHAAELEDERRRAGVGFYRF